MTSALQFTHLPVANPVASQTAPPLRPATRLGQRITKWVADDGSSPRFIRAFPVLFLFLIQLCHIDHPDI